MPDLHPWATARHYVELKDLKFCVKVSNFFLEHVLNPSNTLLYAQRFFAPLAFGQLVRVARRVVRRGDWSHDAVLDVLLPPAPQNNKDQRQDDDCHHRHCDDGWQRGDHVGLDGFWLCLIVVVVAIDFAASQPVVAERSRTFHDLNVPVVEGVVVCAFQEVREVFTWSTKNNRKFYHLVKKREKSNNQSFTLVVKVTLFQ